MSRRIFKRGERSRLRCVLVGVHPLFSNRTIFEPPPSRLLSLARLAQIKHLRPKQYKNLKKREKTVSRAYGGSRCAGCVRQR